MAKESEPSSEAAKDPSRIGERLRRVREERGHPIAVASVISEKYGIRLSSRGLSRMERGLREVPLTILYALADFYKVNPGELVDPAYNASARDLDFLKKDKELLARLEELARNLGSGPARERIKARLAHLVEIINRRKGPKQ